MQYIEVFWQGYSLLVLACYCFIILMTQKQVEKNKKDKRRTTRSDLVRKSQELVLSSQDIKVPPNGSF